MESRKKHINVGDKKVYDQELIYARMIGLMSSSREINIDDCLATELAPYPAPMFDATGMMRMATKSTLKNDLRVNVSGRSFGKPTSVTYDVSALLWTISWPSNAGTLGDFIVKFESIVKHGLTQGNVQSSASLKIRCSLIRCLLVP